MANKYPIAGMFYFLMLLMLIGTSIFAQRSSPSSRTTSTITPNAPNGFRDINPPDVSLHLGISPTSTPTPTSTPDSLTDGGQAPYRGAGDTYAVVAAGDIPTLFEALSEAGQLNIDQPGVPYKIYLAAGEYQLSQTLVVFGTVEIYGAGMANTTLRQIGLPGNQTGSMNTMIKLPGKSLKIDHVTLADGATNFRGGAINVENINAVLTVTNSKFLNNHADDSAEGSGGAIYSVGQVFLEKVYFQGNTSREGGALSNASPITDFAVDAFNVDFQANSASTARGGAIYNAAGKIKVRQSNFRGNSSAAGSDVRKHTHSYLTASVTINARLNYWYNPVVTASANANGVNTLDLLAAKVNFTLDAPQTPPPDPCGTREDTRCLPFPSVTPTATSVPQSFKISTGYEGSAIWTSSQQAAINSASAKLGQAFQLQFTLMGIPVGSPQEAFNRVMADGADPQFVYFYKVYSSSGIVTITYPAVTDKPDYMVPDGVAVGECKAINNNGLPRTIVCNWGPSEGQVSAFPEHALVHELGHVFTNRSSLSNSTNLGERDWGLLYAAIEGTFSGACAPVFALAPTGTPPDPFANMQFSGSNCSRVLDLNGSNGLVMGKDTNQIWQRGRRGWGSGPNTIFTQFQMHPPGWPAFINDTNEEQVDETAADMFLNWVYRMITDVPITTGTPMYKTNVPGNWQGFLNASWTAPSTNGTPDFAYPGDARNEWMSRVMERIFATKNW